MLQFDGFYFVSCLSFARHSGSDIDLISAG